MTIRIETAVRTAMMTALETAIDGGAGPATLEVRTGAQPANANTAASGTLLVTFTMNDPAGAVASGVITFSVSPAIASLAVASGTAGWARLKDSTGATILDGSVGTSATDFIIDTTTVTSGQNIALVAVSTLTSPAT